MADPTQVWIYHERQEARLCGQHALNNLVQDAVFTPSGLAMIADQLDQLELSVFQQNNGDDYQRRLQEGSHNVDAAGNFSIQVLNVALQEQYNVQLSHSLSQDMLKQQQQADITEYQGFLCHKSDHWFSIRQIGGRYWNLNSLLEIPVTISHFTLATEMQQWQNEGYTIFPVPYGLPPVGTKKGSTGVSWHRMSDLIKGKSTEKDPFESLTGGMRLDGKPRAMMHVEGLTEEEELQMALEASLEQPKLAATASTDVPPEPAAGTPNAVRIQFRLPDGGRVVRRFMSTDSVLVVYGFCQEKAGQPIELKFGFPPKDLDNYKNQTIGEAGLAGESVQARFA